ncbi:WAT1-related protein [Spatholobus suberectus]|nr:WAT1-related protein [Spatholobus suberectus]
MENCTPFVLRDLLQDLSPLFPWDHCELGHIWYCSYLHFCYFGCCYHKLPSSHHLFLALLLRIEVLKIKTAPGVAKLVGVVACLTGAAILAFYKGPHLELLNHYHLLGYHKSQQHLGHVASGSWIKGCFLMLLSNTFWGMWLVATGYPSKLLLTTLQCFLSSVQSLAVALAVERDIEQWKLGWNVRLLAVVYCVIL